MKQAVTQTWEAPSLSCLCHYGIPHVRQCLGHTSCSSTPGYATGLREGCQTHLALWARSMVLNWSMGWTGFIDALSPPWHPFPPPLPSLAACLLVQGACRLGGKGSLCLTIPRSRCFVDLRAGTACPPGLAHGAFPAACRSAQTQEQHLGPDNGDPWTGCSSQARSLAPLV